MNGALKAANQNNLWNFFFSIIKSIVRDPISAHKKNETIPLLSNPSNSFSNFDLLGSVGEVENFINIIANNGSNPNITLPTPHFIN